MQLVGPRLALRAFAQTGGSQPPCLFGLVSLCNDRLAQADVVALSEATPLGDLGKILVWMSWPAIKDQTKKWAESAQRDPRQEEEEETEEKERRKERRSRRLSVPKRDQGRGLS